MAVAYTDDSGIFSIQLYHDIYETRDAVRWAMDHGLLSNHKVCQCQSPMMLCTRNSTNDGYVWRCSNNQCRTSKSIRHGIFYEKCNIPLNKCIMVKLSFQIIYLADSYYLTDFFFFLDRIWSSLIYYYIHITCRWLTTGPEWSIYWWHRSGDKKGLPGWSTPERCCYIGTNHATAHIAR